MTTESIVTLLANLLLIPLIGWLFGLFQRAKAKARGNEERINNLIEAVDRAREHRDRLDRDFQTLVNDVEDLMTRVTKMEVKISVFWHDISSDAAKILLDIRKGE